MMVKTINKYILILIILVLSRPAFGQTVPTIGQPQVQIGSLLQHLGYPENTWPAIEKDVNVLLTQIDFPKLKKEAALIKSDPLKLKDFVTKLGGLIEQGGYTQSHPPHPLIKLLTSSLVNDDISQVIFSSPISFWQKVDSKKALVACTAISQLGSIVLDMLDINVKVAYSPAHVFNCVPLDGKQVLIVDFSNQIFKIVDLNQYYYVLGSKTMLLKDKYHISPARVREINGQLLSELHSDTLEEILNFMYLYIYISDDYATTPGILMNFANIYSRKGNNDQAITDSNKAIEIDPENADAYRERASVYGNKGDLDRAIADYNKAIELFPDFADAFHDRGNIYTAKGEFDKAIFDFNQAIIIDPNYAEAFRDRGIVHDNKGELDQAISDYNKAIEIDPYYSEAYQSRAEAYFSKQEYDKSKEDVHKVEDFGDEVNQDLLDKLKKVSDSKNSFFLPILIGAPIILLLVFKFF